MKEESTLIIYPVTLHLQNHREGDIPELSHLVCSYLGKVCPTSIEYSLLESQNISEVHGFFLTVLRQSYSLMWREKSWDERVSKSKEVSWNRRRS